MDLDIKKFINSMEGQTKKFLKEYSDFENHDAVTLDFYDDIEWHLEGLGIKTIGNNEELYNGAYTKLESAYMEYLKKIKK